MKSLKVKNQEGWRLDPEAGIGCYIHDSGASVCKSHDDWQAWSPGSWRTSKKIGTRKTRNAAMKLALSQEKSSKGKK